MSFYDPPFLTKDEETIMELKSRIAAMVSVIEDMSSFIDSLQCDEYNLPGAERVRCVALIKRADEVI